MPYLCESLSFLRSFGVLLPYSGRPEEFAIYFAYYFYLFGLRDVRIIDLDKAAPRLSGFCSGTRDFCDSRRFMLGSFRILFRPFDPRFRYFTIGD